MNADLPRAILLDLDDTIVDFSGNVETAWADVCREIAVSNPAIDPSSLYAKIFEIRAWYWADPEMNRVGRQDLRAASAWIATEALKRTGIVSPELGSAISERYRNLREKFGLMPNAVETLKKLRGLGISLALLTNGTASGQRAKIERFDLARHFDFVCIEGEFGCGKPDERVYRAALDALNARPEQTWMAGDNFEWDVAAPMKLGITGIWLDYYSSGLPQSATTQPHRIIRSISELL